MIIVDSSVAVKWIQEKEEDSDIAFLLATNHRNHTEEILAPDLLYVEIANALATKPTSTPQIIKESLSGIFKLELKPYSLSHEDILKSALLAKRYNTSAYDMLYAVIAKKKKCKLITADEKFVVKTRFKFVKLLKDIESMKQEL